MRHWRVRCDIVFRNTESFLKTGQFLDAEKVHGVAGATPAVLDPSSVACF